MKADIQAIFVATEKQNVEKIYGEPLINIPSESISTHCARVIAREKNNLIE